MMFCQKAKCRAVPIILAAAIALIAQGMMGRQIGILESRFGDFVWQLLSNNDTPEQRIVVIDIDDKSVSKYGPWPWTRQTLTELLAKLREHGVAMRILDITFPAEKTGDEQFADELKKLPTIAAQVLAIDADESTNSGELQAGHDNQSCKNNVPRANAIIANAEKLKTASAGHITPRIDSDGTIRRLPAIICYGDKAYAALGLSAFAQAFSLPPTFDITPGIHWLDPDRFLQHPGILGFKLPVNRDIDIMIPWWTPRESIVSLSAKDVLEDRIPKDFLQGAWALIGGTAFGIGDTVPTPQGKAVSGLEVHMQLLTALLDDKIPYKPQGAVFIQVIWLLVTAFLLASYPRERRGINISKTLWIALLLIAITFILHVAALAKFKLWLPWVTNEIAILITAIFLLGQEYRQSKKESQLLYQNLSSYLPEHVAKQISRQRPIDSIDAHREQVIVLYADLRNFSAWCDQLPAEQVGAVLHSFYTLTDQVIRRHGGITEEYIGDAVMGVWRDGDNSVKALDAAKDLVAESEKWFGQDTNIDQLPPLAIGVGLEKGDAMIGSFGPSNRRAHTLLGKAVTTAIHLQTMTADLAHPILIGENAANPWSKHVAMQSLGRFLLKDSAQPIELFIPKIEGLVSR